MSNSRTAWALLAAVCAAFAWGLVRLYDLRLVAGDIYPVYSSYRSDPLGAKVLFESLAQLPGYTSERNFRDLDDLHQNSGTLLWLGEDPFLFALRPEEDFKQFEAIASRGIRLVFAMAPIKRLPPSAQTVLKERSLEKRWGITFVYVRRLASETEDHEGPLPKRTALVIKTGAQVTPFVEEQFGKGSVVLIDTAYPLSNEALATERDTPLIERVLGANHTVIFDEHHLGLSENASIAMLARKYRLMGLAAGLLILAALFIWRNSSPLLPPRRRPAWDEARLAAGRDSASALQHLLRRNIAESDLIPACVREWEKSGREARGYSPDNLAAIRQLAKPQGKRHPAEVYRKMQSIIANSTHAPAARNRSGDLFHSK